MRIRDESVVTVSYALATTEGDFYDEADPRDPLVYVHGHHAIVPGLEHVLAGRAPGESLMVVIPPACGHGEYDARLELTVPLVDLPDDLRPRLAAGFSFTAEHPFTPGERREFLVTHVSRGMAAISGNHRLAGRTLLVKADVLAVREASADEMASGEPEDDDDDDDLEEAT
jgi:FKBP-type peptidyl-prolyl cis-trans isomerase SlyD